MQRGANIFENFALDSSDVFLPQKVNKRSRLRGKVFAESETWLVGILTLAIYFPGIMWGLPNANNSFGTHSWEIDAVTGIQTLSELHNLFILPKADWYLAYPLFHYIIIGIFYAPYLGFLYLTGDISQITADYPYGLRDPETVLRNLTLIGRAITLLMASGVVVSAYLTARTVWDKQTARITAVAAALPTTMVFYARTGNLEVPMMFWISLTILFLARCLIFGFSPHRAVWLGVFSAISVATKDSAYGALTIGLITLCIIQMRYGTPNSDAVPRWKSPLILVFTGLAAYVLISGLLISPHRFFGHLAFVRNFETTFYSVIHLDLLRPATPFGYAILSLDIASELVNAIGVILLIVGIIGLAAAWRSSHFTKIMLAMMCGYLTLVIMPVRFMQFRYIIVPAFIFSFFIARGFALGMQQNRQWLKTATLVTMILGFGWVGLRAVDLTYQMLFDSRYKASQWLAQNAHSGDRIAFSSVPNILPPLPPEITAVQLMDNSNPLEKLRREKIRFVLVQADWSSSKGDKYSHFFPESLYRQLDHGSIEYRQAAAFETAPLFKGFGLNLPLVTPGYIVNPPIRVYELIER